MHCMTEKTSSILLSPNLEAYLTVSKHKFLKFPLCHIKLKFTVAVVESLSSLLGSSLGKPVLCKVM